MKSGNKHPGVSPWLAVMLLAAAATLASGCRTWSFYSQAVKGQVQIIHRREPVDRLLADAQTPPRLKAELELARRLCAFAEGELKLPANGHYRHYADLDRPYVVWNVQAAPRFSLEPTTWWYPIVGRLEYRGFFTEEGALALAGRLAAEGYDVSVDGVEAYSTLGWFKDPLLNTFIDHPEPELAEILIHELAHQRLFVGGDTDFDEAFATTVGREGARRWLQANGRTNLCAEYEIALRRNDQFARLILDARSRLETVYWDTRDADGKIKAARVPPQPAEILALEKQGVFDDLRRDYARLKAGWGGYSGYDGWFARELNNARLNTIANYYDLVPGFVRLLELNGDDLEAFYRAAERLKKLAKAERHERLRALAGEDAGPQR